LFSSTTASSRRDPDIHRAFALLQPPPSRAIGLILSTA
jgi:hypothetical protein